MPIRVHPCSSAPLHPHSRPQCGCSESRIWLAWLTPRLRGIFLTQFFLSIPLFILGEASLGVLGLGVAEPMASWGNLLRDLCLPTPPPRPPLKPMPIRVHLCSSAAITLLFLLPRSNGTPLHPHSRPQCGGSESRIWLAWLTPRLRGIFLTQFFLSIPLFILGEASLGVLGLGVAEPTASWGNLLRELTTAPPLNQYWIFAPVALLILVMTSFQLLLPAHH